MRVSSKPAAVAQYAARDFKVSGLTGAFSGKAGDRPRGAKIHGRKRQKKRQKGLSTRSQSIIGMEEIALKVPGKICGRKMSVSQMEPMIPAENRELADLAADLIGKASGLAARLSPALRQSIGDLVRSVNCYYSNLIENHNTTQR